MQRSDIQTITNITKAIANPASGDVIVLDIDETLLLTGFTTFSDAPKLTEPELPAEILRLQERGIRVIGITSRPLNNAQATQEQLKQAGIQLEVLHAPDIQSADGSAYSGKGKVVREYLEVNPPKRIFVVDNARRHLEAIQTECKGLSIPLFLKHYIFSHSQPLQIDDDNSAYFPENLHGFQKEKFLGGGTASVFSIRHPGSEQRLVLKLGAHEDGAKVEMLCNAVYRILGVDVPKMRVYHALPKTLAAELGLKYPYRYAQLSEFITAGKTHQPEIIKKSARDHFVVHALLGNIDVAKEDNFIVDQHNKTYLIDAGANFIFRSLGERRKEAPSLVSEMETLRDKSFNDKGPVWFGDLTDDEIRRQLEHILSRQQELTATVWNLSRQLQLPDELRDKFLQCLADRLDALVTQYISHPQVHAKVNKRAQAGVTAAGVLTYTMRNGVPYVLLSKRRGHEWWDNFGGKSEAGDESLLATARREVAEESGQQLHYTDRELLDSPFHDIVTSKRWRDQQLYRMYICAYEYIDPAKFHDDEHSAHQWVALKDILDGRQGLTLYPPLAAILQQQPVRATLEELLRTGSVKRRHTLGYAEIASHAAPAQVYRPLLSPLTKRQQIAATLAKKSTLVRELKRERLSKVAVVDDAAVKRHKTVTVLSQSEIHLKAMLGDAYQADNLAANVRLFVSTHFSNSEEQERLIAYGVALIENEKRGGDHNIYFYHACSNSIAFAYDVYTTLYRALRQDDQWTAFRPDSEHFQRFLNINEFIAFYSDNGRRNIDNNARNYNDCALSANVFLFGNHALDSSCSISYLVNNNVRRQIDLSLLFAQLLAPFHVTATEIKRLLSTFDRYYGDNGGTMYQIAMPVEQARVMSYPSGCGGVMYKLNDNQELPLVLAKLRESTRADTYVSGETRKYISDLQARVMVPPHLKLATHEVKWKQMPDATQAEYQAALGKTVNAFVDKMLCHHGPDNAINTGVPLLRVLPSVLQANQISYSAVMTQQTLLRAIIAEDAAAIRTILRKYPELLHAKIEDKHEYFVSYIWYQQQDDKTMSVVEMILERQGIPLDVMIDFSDNDWLKHDMFCKIYNGETLRNWLVRIPAECRNALLMKLSPVTNYQNQNMRHIELIESVDQLCGILKLLPSAAALSVAKYCHKLIISAEDVSRIMAELAESDRLLYARLMHANIFTGKGLVMVLTRLPESERSKFATEQLHKMINSVHMRDVLQCIPVGCREDFLAANEDKIKNNSISGLMPLIEPEGRLKFAKAHFDKITEGSELIKVLSVLPDQHDMFIRGWIKDIEKLLEVLDGISEPVKFDKFDLALDYRSLIKNYYDLERVIKRLPSSQCLAFAIVNEDKITSRESFWLILRAIQFGRNEFGYHLPTASLLLELARTHKKDEVAEFLSQNMQYIDDEERSQILRNKFGLFDRGLVKKDDEIDVKPVNGFGSGK